MNGYRPVLGLGWNEGMPWLPKMIYGKRLGVGGRLV